MSRANIGFWPGHKTAQGQYALGFTLLEVLVALGIVAVVAVLSWRGLQGVLTGAQAVQRQDHALQVALAVFAQLENDLATAHPMPPGQQPPSPVQLTDQGLLLQGVWHGSLLLPQAPDTKQIAWMWTAKGLARQVQWPFAKQTPQHTALEGVAGMQLRLLYRGNTWGPAYVYGAYRPLPAFEPALQGPSMGAVVQPGAAVGSQAAAPLVLAVEVALSLDTEQTWVRLLPLSAALVAGQKGTP